MPQYLFANSVHKRNISPMPVLLCRLAVDVTRAPEVVSSRSPGPPSSARAPSVSAGAGSSGVHSSAAHVAPVSSGTAGAVSTLISHAGARSLSTAASTASTAIAPPASASSSSGGSGGSGTSGRRVYGGTFDCLRSTYQLEGVRGVYSGFGVSLAGETLLGHELLSVLCGGSVSGRIVTELPRCCSA
jgi:hypothetical protein